VRWRPDSAGWCRSGPHEVPVDAQLPVKLVQLLRTAGHDAVHTSELPEGNRTTDQALARKADVEGRVVVTKDRDFRDGHLLSRSPCSMAT
jgi:predicted nuclease of predicted toxin-antitoxin system